jgi:hypothetical protein
MKQKFTFPCLPLFFVIASVTGFAQRNEPEGVRLSTPKWISEIGYWVVEDSIDSVNHYTVYLYNNNNILVYKETVDGCRLDLNKRKTKMRLKKLVDQTVMAYAQRPKVSENKMLVLHLTR